MNIFSKKPPTTAAKLKALRRAMADIQRQSDAYAQQAQAFIDCLVRAVDLMKDLVPELESLDARADDKPAIERGHHG